METRIGWRRALLAAESCDVTVLCGPQRAGELTGGELTERAAHERGLRRGLRFIRVEHDAASKLLCSYASTYYLGYRRWTTLALRVAEEMHAARRFDLAHQVTFCGYREPGLLWKLGVPFVWGPVGGTQNFPVRFLGAIGLPAGAREAARNVINWAQLRYSPRVRAAAESAATVIAATSTAQRDLRAVLGIDADVQLETGLDCEVGPPRERRNPSAPLRLLWAGRLRPWKAFPLLIQALGQLPSETRVRLRVLGEGPCGAKWRRLADRAAVGHLIEWVGWGEYDQTLKHYRWADAFVFTSLRDTSGTGLLESLSAGAPIIGLAHQGAADVMTPDCAVAAPPDSPAVAARGIASAIAGLAGDSDRLLQLSRGAQQRAADFDWGLRADTTRRVYESVIAASAATPASIDAIAGREPASPQTALIDPPQAAAPTPLFTR